MKSLLTIIIPTYQKRESLRALVESLNRQTHSDFNIIVADNGSSDESFLHAQDCLSSANFPFSILRLPENLGPGNARNKAILECSSPYVAFTDDDCLAPKDWVKVIIESLNLGHHCIYGPVTSSVPPLNPFIHAFSMETNKVFGAGNCAFKTDYFKEIGGFNPNMNNWGEDYELSQRIKKQIIYVPQMLINHPPKVIDYGINYSLHSHNWLDKFYYLDYKKIDHKFNYINETVVSFIKKIILFRFVSYLAIKICYIFLCLPLFLSFIIFLRKSKQVSKHLRTYNSNMSISKLSILKYSLYYWVIDIANVFIIVSYKIKRVISPKEYEEMKPLK